MNNKAQGGILAFIFLILIFIILWAVWLGDFVNTIAQQAIIDGQLTGVEAFVLSNLNLVIIVGIVLGLMVFIYFGRNA